MKSLTGSIYRRRKLIKQLLLGIAGILFILLVLWPTFKANQKQPAGANKPLLGTAIKMMNGAHFYGTTSKGESYTINSQKIVQTNLQEFVLEEVLMVFKNLHNKEIHIKATKGITDNKEKKMNLFNGITLNLEDGSQLQTASAHLDLEKGCVQGQESVQGSGPLGTLQAGGFEIEDKGKILRFTNRVKVTLNRSRL